jgi:TetR/AcrR family transcriptional regulator
MTSPAPTTRAQQRLDTRERIVEAAVRAFAEKGFRGASTRDIAQRAGTNQGLITYHFKSKDELWRAAADRTFMILRTSLGERVATLESGDPRERSRVVVREYVRFVAAHPELFRLMVDEGKNSEDRMKWLVDTHLKPHFDQFTGVGGAPAVGVDPVLAPHAWYVMAGAASLIFAVAPECRRLTGIDPESDEVIERHAEFVARLLVP